MPSPRNIGRVIGAAGSSVPVVGDVGVLAFIKKKAGTPIGIGAKQGLKYAGGPIAVASWTYMGYQNRHLPGQIYGNMQIGYDQWKQRPEMRKVDRTTKTLKASGGRSRGNTRTIVGSGGRSRGGRGATTLSQRASRSVRPGKRRQRCKSRNKSGKTCLRPRNHSGRHRFQ